MIELKELYENKLFAMAMSQLTPEQRLETEKELVKLIRLFTENVIQPLEKSGIGKKP